MKSRVGGKRVATNDCGKAFPGIVDLGGNGHVAILRGEHAVHGRLRQVVSGLHRDLLAAAHGVALQRIVVHAHHAIVERHVNVTTLARRCAADERRADCRHAMGAGIHVGDGHPEQRRRRARHAEHRHGAAFRLGDHPEPRPRRIGTGVAVGGQRTVDQTRIERRQRRVAQAQFLQRARTIILDEYIGGLREFEHQLVAPRILQVHAQSLLAHVLLQKVAALTVDEIGMVSTRIAVLWPLDLDHLRAHSGQTAAQVRAGQEVRVIDDAKAGERKGLHCH